MPVIRIALATVAMLVLAAPLHAEDAKKADKAAKGAAKKQAEALDAVFMFPKVVEPSEEQKTKLAALRTELGPKLTEAQKAVATVLTPEQRQIRRDTSKANKDAGLKGKEARAAVMAAMKLTDEQKKSLDTAEKAQAEVRKEIDEKIVALLTDEQKAKVAEAKKLAKKKKDK